MSWKGEDVTTMLIWKATWCKSTHAPR